MEHSQECRDRFEEYNRQVAEYFYSWPHHCKHCRGWGGFYSQYDPSPSGVSLSAGYMVDFDPCEKCCENGICPRCGRLLDEYEEFDDPCPHCGFEFDGSTDGEPVDVECYCDVRDSLSILYDGV